jgi:hypothetical protein
MLPPVPKVGAKMGMKSWWNATPCMALNPFNDSSGCALRRTWFAKILRVSMKYSIGISWILANTTLLVSRSVWVCRTIVLYRASVSLRARKGSWIWIRFYIFTLGIVARRSKIGGRTCLFYVAVITAHPVLTQYSNNAQSRPTQRSSSGHPVLAYRIILD